MALRFPIAPGTDPGRLAGKRRPWGFGAFALIVLACITFLTMAPLLVMAVRLFWSDGSISLDTFAQVFAMPDLPRLIGNTLIVVTVSSALALAIGSLLAWLEHRTDAKMGAITSVLPLVPFILPPIAGSVAWVLLLADRAGFVNTAIRSVLNLFGAEMTEGPFSIYSYYGLVLVYVVYQVPFVFLMVSAGLRNISPSLEEQSRSSGAGLVRTLTRVTLPALLPSLGGAVLLMAWQGFALYSIPVVIGSPAHIDVLAVRIVDLIRSEYPPRPDLAVGLSSILVSLVLVVWLIQSKLLRSGRYASISGKGNPQSRIRLGVWKWPARLFVLGYLLVTAVLPVLALVVVALQGFWTANINPAEFSLNSIMRQLSDPISQRAMLNSLLLAIVCSTIAILAAAVISVYIRTLPRGRATIADGLVKMPAVVSNVILAIGILLLFGGPPLKLTGTLLILGIAYVSLYFPQGSAATDTAASQIGAELTEASQSSGASGWRTFVRINLPLMLPGLVAGWAFLFSRIAGDLTASALLSGTKNPVLGYRILEMYQNGSFAATATISLMLVVMVTIVLAVALWFSSRRGVDIGGMAR